MILEAIESTLSRLILENGDAPHADLFAAARYILLSPGKRLRPQLAIATATAYGASLDEALTPACALELIHTYSLVHDDLPCMDDDDFRRGQPTIHKVYNEAHAVLTGDYLLTYAFEILATAPHLTAEARIELVQVLARQAGAHGLIGGQVVDLALSPSWELVHFAHQGKTAALMSASFEFGAIIGKAPLADRALLKEAGLTLGLAFQVIDDILDQDPKPSAFSLLGEKDARALAKTLSEKAEHLLDQLSVPVPHLRQLALKLIDRDD